MQQLCSCQITPKRAALMHLLNVQQGLRGWNDVGLWTGWRVLTPSVIMRLCCYCEHILTSSGIVSFLEVRLTGTTHTDGWIPSSVPLIFLFLLSYNYYRNIPQTCAGCHYLQSYWRNAQKQHPMQNASQTSLFFPVYYLNSSVIFLISKIA